MFCYWERKVTFKVTFFWHPRLMLIKSMLSFQVLSFHYSDWITYYCPPSQTPEIIAQPASECFVFALRHPYPISLLSTWIIVSVPKAKSLISHLSGKRKTLNHKIIQNRSVIQMTFLMCLCLCYIYTLCLSLSTIRLLIVSHTYGLYSI